MLVAIGTMEPITASARFIMGMPAAALDGMEPVIKAAEEPVEGTTVAVGIMDIPKEGEKAREDIEAVAGIEDMAGIGEDEFCWNHHESSVGNETILQVRGEKTHAGSEGVVKNCRALVDLLGPS